MGFLLPALLWGTIEHSMKTRSFLTMVHAHIRRLAILTLLLGLAACATPQEKAIAAHCQAEGMRLIPLQTVPQQVMRSFHVGDRITGFRNSCRTVTRDGKDDKGNTIKIRETVCRDDPVYTPVYEQRMVTEMVDQNLARRQSFERVCATEAKARGMFAHLQ